MTSRNSSILKRAAAVSTTWKVLQLQRNTKSIHPSAPRRDARHRWNVLRAAVYFLPRHGRGHRILPHELNHRANIYALRSLNVRWIICVTAVGSLQEKYAPRDVLLPSQFYDRTQPANWTYIFRRGNRGPSASPNRSREVAQSARGSSTRAQGDCSQRRHIREHGWSGVFDPSGKSNSIAATVSM